MRAADDILRKAKRLPARERQRIVSALTRMDKATRKPRRNRGTKAPVGEARRIAAMEAFMKLVGHSDFTDVSSNKYKHLGEIYADNHRG
jgi:hypothetical protein